MYCPLVTVRGVSVRGGLPDREPLVRPSRLDRDPQTEIPSGQRPPGQRPPWTETCLDRAPLDRDRRWTETPWTETTAVDRRHL